jgi:hypothetical protein
VTGSTKNLMGAEFSQFESSNKKVEDGVAVVSEDERAKSTSRFLLVGEKG